MAKGSRYEARGVSSSKDEVHAVVGHLDQGIFPGAFCKVTKDVLTCDPEKCNIIHADGTGTKSILAYLLYKETGDASYFRASAQDSIVMNLDDLLCVGATSNMLLASTINRNALLIPGEVLAEVIDGTSEFLAWLREMGIGIESGGGETADLGDIVRTISIDSSIAAVMERSQVINNANIAPGLSIVGFASFGKSDYEDTENSGIGSNGLTSARHDLLSRYYLERYPETADSHVDSSLLYCGDYKLDDRLVGADMSIGEALTSPTRTYAPVIRSLLRENAGRVKGLVHCSGGGQTKCLRFGRNTHFVKDSLFEPPPIFRLIREASQVSWREMYQTYNMGHRMEVFCDSEDVSRIIKTAESYGVEAKVVGRTVSADAYGTNYLTIQHDGEEIHYSL